MAFHVEYRVAAKPDVVLATIRREAPYVRESQTPEELRTPRTFGVAVRVRKDNFRLYRERGTGTIRRIRCRICVAA